MNALEQLLQALMQQIKQTKAVLPYHSNSKVDSKKKGVQQWAY